MLLTASPSNQLTQYGSVPKSSNFEKIRLRRAYQLLFQEKNQAQGQQHQHIYC